MSPNNEAQASLAAFAFAAVFAYFSIQYRGAPKVVAPVAASSTAPVTAPAVATGLTTPV